MDIFFELHVVVFVLVIVILFDYIVTYISPLGQILMVHYQTCCLFILF